MRKISDVITQILALLPDPTTVMDPALSAGVVSLKAELTTLVRRSQYTAPEDTSGWPNLNNLLYRYLPPASPTSGYTWAWQISLTMRGVTL